MALFSILGSFWGYHLYVLRTRKKRKILREKKLPKTELTQIGNVLDLARAHGQAPVGKLGGEPQRASWSPGKKNNDLSKTLDKWVT